MTEIILTQASGQTTDTPAQVGGDTSIALAYEPTVLGMTELGKVSHVRAVASACTANGYRLFAAPPKIETGLALHPAALPIANGAIRAHDGLEGQYEPRHVQWLRFDYRGETITVVEAHWVRPGSTIRHRHRKQMTGVVLDLMGEHSQRRELAFCLGDANEDDIGSGDGGPVARAFRDAHATTVYDELGLYPSTGPGGGTIDWIASMDRDTRVRATDLRVRRTNSDHKQVTAHYQVIGRFSA